MREKKRYDRDPKGRKAKENEHWETAFWVQLFFRHFVPGMNFGFFEHTAIVGMQLPDWPFPQ